jgi:hypothetical protein
MTRAILTMGNQTKIIQYLIPGLGDRDLFFSFGETVPNLSLHDAVSYWMGGAYALKLQTIGLAQNLCSPGSEWLSSVDTQLLGRTIRTGELKDLESDMGKLWVKPSESKIPSFPAGAYSAESLTAIYKANNLPENTSIQWTSSILDVDYEHRFFVIEGNIVTGSPYRVDGVLYGDAINFSYLELARSFAQEALQELGDNVPPAFTLDVGYDKKAQNWLIIEANRAWSSGFYGSKSAAALEAVEYSCQYSGRKWQWIPDAPLLLLNENYTPLRVTANDDDYGFVKYNSDK